MSSASNSCFKKIEDKPFITYNYNCSGSDKDYKPSKCYCYNPSNQKFEAKTVYRESVFYNLRNEIFALSDDQYERIDKQYRIRDTLPFFTNTQALDYFRRLIPANSPVLDFCAGKPAKQFIAGSSSGQDLQSYISKVMSSKFNIEKIHDSLDKATVLLNNVGFFRVERGKTFRVEDDEAEDKILKNYSVYFRRKSNPYLINEEILNFRERSKIKHIANFVEQVSKEKFFERNIVDLDFLSICPEFALQAETNRIRTLFIANLYFYYGNYASMDNCVLLIYGIDLKEKKIYNYSKLLGMHGERNYDDKFESILSECESQLKR